MTQLLTENLGWKLLALLISAALWYGFVGETELATSVPAAVQYKNAPTDLEISSEQLDRIYVRLRGPATRLNAGSLTQLTVVFDLDEVDSPGERTFTLGANNLRLPPGVHAGTIVPSQMRLTFERRVNREVPVEIRMAGPPPKGYRVTGQNPVPDRVAVIGPESRVRSLTSVHTDAIDLSSTVGSAEFRVPAVVADPQIRFPGDPPLISVRVFLEKIPQ